LSSLVTYRSSEVPKIWPYVKPLIQKALDQQVYEDWTIDEVYEGLCERKYQLWTSESDVIEAAWVTAIQEKHGVTFCLLLACGGENVHAWKHFLEHVAGWAKTKGATELLIYGRPGWARLLKFETCYAVMRKGL
jgi:hypothetical protein